MLIKLILCYFLITNTLEKTLSRNYLKSNLHQDFKSSFSESNLSKPLESKEFMKKYSDNSKKNMIKLKKFGTDTSKLKLNKHLHKKTKAEFDEYDANKGFVIKLKRFGEYYLAEVRIPDIGFDTERTLFDTGSPAII